MQKILSLIIPTYNMEKYLDRCLSSLILPDEGLMKQLEVLVINDGSTDKSSAIAHGYEDRFPLTFQVIDKENGNYGSCINCGLRIARGKYIKVLDADDWFDNAQFARYLDILVKVDADAVFNDFVRVYGNEKKSVEVLLPMTPYSLQEQTALSSNNRHVVMHQVAYRTELLRRLDYRQTEGISYTDEEWVFIPISAAKKLYYIPGVLYHYFLGREDQTVSANVRAQHYGMVIKGIDIMLVDLGLIQNQHGSRNGIALNIEYLKVQATRRCRNVYESLIINKSLKAYLPYMCTLDSRLRTQFPELYQLTNDAFYPRPSETQYKWRVHFIKTWRNWGLFGCRLQLFFVHHHMGLVSRLHLFG